MEGARGSGLESALMKKRRSSTSRRPRPGTMPVVDQQDMSSSSSMSSWSNSRKPSLDDSAVISDGGFRRREFYLNNPPPASALKRTTEGILSPANLRSSHKTKGSNQLHSGTSDLRAKKAEVRCSIPAMAEGRDLSAKEKPRKMKLKIGGITCTIPAKPSSEMPDARPPLARPPRPDDTSQHRHKHGPMSEGSKDSSKVTSSHDRKRIKKEKLVEETLAQEQTNLLQKEPTSQPVRKSRRVQKKRLLDGEFDEDHDVHLLEKLATSRNVEDYPQEDANSGKSSAKKKKVSRTTNVRSMPYQVDDEFVMSRSNRDGRKRLIESSDGNNTGEEEPTSDSELEAKNERQKEPVEAPAIVRSEPLRTRRRALQSWIDGNVDSAIEFPNGLPPAPSRSKKNISEEEKLAKKAEAAQRRRMQVEKAARESEAEAVRKILGLDTDKKKEEKKQKEREDKERAARSRMADGRTVRWVMGPTGTVVSFPDDVGLPSIFSSKPCSYPPPRERCAGPSCTNAYRYRDSKLKLPLCSLECYRALHSGA